MASDGADDVNTSDVENEDDMDETIGAGGGGHRFQNIQWTASKLPYAKELEEAADAHFASIKTFMAKAVLLGDLRKGLSHYVIELDRYINLYSYRFSKEDHVALLSLLAKFIRKGQIFRDTRIVIRGMRALLRRRDCLSRDDFTCDWRPFYELYDEVAYGNLEEDGVFLMPEDFKSELAKLIRAVREFWPLGASQEILDELRPLFCPWDETILKGMKLAQMFLPTTLSVEEHRQFGAGLWFEEMWHFYITIENNSHIDPYLVHLFTRLARDCPGLIDWEEKMDLIFTRMVRSMRMSQGIGMYEAFPVKNGAIWLVYVIGVEKRAQEMLSRMLAMMESFLHPSNHGEHSGPLLNFLYRLVNEMVLRVRRERTGHPHPIIPDALKLTQEAIDTFVLSLLPCFKLAIFTKVKQELISYIVKNIALLAPRILIPAILDIVYPALDTVTEPHRLTQTLRCLFVALIPMLRDRPPPGERSRRAEVVYLLEALIPAIDPNDINKALLCFQTFGILVNTVPIVDCSDAVHIRSDLSEDEKEICSATANFEGIVAALMDKMMSFLEWGAGVVGSGAGAGSAGHGSLLKVDARYNTEETIVHDGVRSVFKGLVVNSSSQIYQLVVDRLYNYAVETLHDSHVVASTLSEMISLAVRARPEVSFNRFFTLIFRKLSEVVSEETYKEEKTNFAVSWWLLLASGLFRSDADVVLQHKAEALQLLRLVLPIQCKHASVLSCHLLKRILKCLTLSYLQQDRRALALIDSPLDEYLPIREWAAPLDRKAFDIAGRWFIPTEASIAMAKEILDEFAVPLLHSLQASAKDIPKSELLRQLRVIHAAVVGSAFSLPLLDSPDVIVYVTPTPIEAKPPPVKPAGTPDLSLPAGSGTLRGLVLRTLEAVVESLLTSRESEVSAMNTLIDTLNALVFNRGFDRKKQQVTVRVHQMGRLIMGDRLHGTQSYIKPLGEDAISIAHQSRVVAKCVHHLNEEYLRIVKLLFRIGMCSYAANRRTAQAELNRMLREFPNSFTVIIDPLLEALDPANDTQHGALKGALHMLCEGGLTSILLRQVWTVTARTWPALIRLRPTERPSIIRLLDNAQNNVVEHFESFRIEEQPVVEGMPELARALLESGKESRQSALAGPPSEEELVSAKAQLEQVQQSNREAYAELVKTLVTNASDSSLHWLHTDMAHALLSILIRRDVRPDDDAARLFLRLLVHDSLKSRKMASAYISAWLKITKPKAIKRPFTIPNTEPNRGPGARWPIRYGILSDNATMIYDPEKLPASSAEWDSFPFCAKIHWGFYTWPRELRTYAPVKEQVHINRKEEELGDVDKFVLGTFRDPAFMERFMQLYSIEEKKGEDKFDTVIFALFHGLCRSYNDMLLPVFKGALEQLATSSDDGKHKLAAELFAGIVNGSKMWKFEKVETLWSWLRDLLSRVLPCLRDAPIRHWSVAMAAICGSNEARQLQPLLDTLFEQMEQPCDNCFFTASRHLMLQSALCQFEWRVLPIWQRYAPFLLDMITQPYQNVRERIASALISLVFFDLKGVSFDPKLPEKFRPFTFDKVLAKFEELLADTWEEVTLAESTDPSSSSVSLSLLSNGGNGDDPKKRASRLALKTFIHFVLNYCLQMMNAIPIRVFELAPMFAHFSNDIGDGELHVVVNNLNVHVLSTLLITGDRADNLVELFEKHLSGRYWWKTKVALLNQLRSLVFANPFTFAAYNERVARLVCRLMADTRLEVREAAATALSLLVHSAYLPVTQAFIDELEGAARSMDAILRHSGVLGLSAIVLAFPYSIPDFLPAVLASLCRHGHEREPIKETVKKALSEFKRTHQDCWHEHKMAFTEDQLAQLTDFLVSPNYYV